MARKGTVVFDKARCGWQANRGLRDVTSGKAYEATVYGPYEADERGTAGCGCDYIVFKDDVGDRIGFGWDKYEGVEVDGVVFTEDK